MNLTDLIKDVGLNKTEDLSIPPCEDEVLVLNESVQNKTDAKMEPPNNYAHCIAVMGAAGGVGTTSLCVQLAHNLAVDSQKKLQKNVRSKEPRTCLIDLDFEGGACAHHLDIAPSLSISDLMQTPDHIDRAFVSALVSTHSSGIDLLATPNTLGGNDMVSSEAIVALLDVISQMYDHIIIDVPRYWRPWNMAAIGASDKFVIVTDLTIPSLQLARMRIKAIEEKFDSQVHAEIILNKYERRSFRNALREKDAETALKREILVTICVDNDTLREAINCGEPAGVIRPDSRYVKDMRQLQKALLVEESIGKRTAA